MNTTQITWLLSVLFFTLSCEKRQYFDRELQSCYDAVLEYEHFLIKAKYLDDDTGESYQKLWQMIDVYALSIHNKVIIPKLEFIKGQKNRENMVKCMQALQDSIGISSQIPIIALQEYYQENKIEETITRESLADLFPKIMKVLGNKFTKEDWEHPIYKISFLCFLYNASISATVIDLHLKSENEIYFNDKRIAYTSLLTEVKKFKENLPKYLKDSVVFRLQSDANFKFQLLIDIKIALGKENIRTVLY